jgi:hypothetical protein
LAYLLPCASDDSYELENAEKGHQEDNSDLKEPENNIRISNIVIKEKAPM